MRRTAATDVLHWQAELPEYFWGSLRGGPYVDEFPLRLPSQIRLDEVLERRSALALGGEGCYMALERLEVRE